ncbi:MAG: hypothetical protein HPY85_12610 [Anaerolineae bacterium]|nr:hypothetical protein [Anaerolineae bacterium]
MNDLIQRQAVLYNRNKSLKFLRILMPIGCVMGMAVNFYLLTHLDQFLPPGNPGQAPFQVIAGVLLLAMPCSMVLQEIQVARLLQPIRVLVDGLALHQNAGDWQLIPWDAVTSIRQMEDTRSAGFLQTTSGLSWLVETRTTVKYAILPRQTIRLIITDSHDEYRALLDLLKEKTGLPIEKKRNLPRWNNHSGRI